MGTYLSTPVTDKAEESGESLECPDVPCEWGVVDMQGWRKSMEDAHVAVTDIPLPLEKGETHNADAKVFGVFDGHGGPEVARFVALYLVSVLTQQPTWKNGVPISPNPDSYEPRDGVHTNVGVALRSAFHALDRMIDDPGRREELSYLRNSKPQFGERRDAISIPADPNEVKETITTPEEKATNKEDNDGGANEKSEDAPKSKDDKSPSAESPNKDSESEPIAEAQEKAENPTECATAENRDEPAAENEEDDDSTEAVGKEEAAEKDRDMMNGEGDKDGEDKEIEDDQVTVEVDPSKPVQITSMFQKILALGGQGGQIVVKVGGDQSENSKDSPTKAAPVPATPTSGPSPYKATILQNGRMICNLPDHPIHAGATAIVAVITGRMLTVANAGDSRAVLCRAGGKTVALSFDHKPQQEREMNRIAKAGGFVNHFGRVNGNLNLSRSLGDLKYKQVPGVSPPDQIITAEPDILQVALEPDDEFIILGCDGIWDCLTNEEAVEFVAQRIDTKTPTEIGVEMLDTIVSEDPRVTQGIGGDNMTIMVIDLKPSSRNNKGSPQIAPATE